MISSSSLVFLSTYSFRFSRYFDCTRSFAFCSCSWTILSNTCLDSSSRLMISFRVRNACSSFSEKVRESEMPLSSLSIKAMVRVVTRFFFSSPFSMYSFVSAFKKSESLLTFPPVILISKMEDSLLRRSMLKPLNSPTRPS